MAINNDDKSNESIFPQCPIRFNALRKMIPDISQKMLTYTLRTLEEDGVLARRVK